jgi:hypothetical protein
LSSVKGSKSVNSNVEAKSKRAAKQLASLKGLGSERPKTKRQSEPGANRAASKEAKASNQRSKGTQSWIGQTTKH